MASLDLGADERGVTEVIGVVLMVGITVALASTLGPALFELADRPADHPTASFAFDRSDCQKTQQLHVTHTAGDSIPAERLSLKSPTLDLGGSWASPEGYTVSGNEDGTISAGDTATICVTGFEKATVSVVWESKQGHSIRLGVWTAAS